jgi:hypothetical protein
LAELDCKVLIIGVAQNVDLPDGRKIARLAQWDLYYVADTQQCNIPASVYAEAVRFDEAASVKVAAIARS